MNNEVINMISYFKSDFTARIIQAYEQGDCEELYHFIDVCKGYISSKTSLSHEFFNQATRILRFLIDKDVDFSLFHTVYQVTEMQRVYNKSFDGERGILNHAIIQHSGLTNGIIDLSNFPDFQFSKNEFEDLGAVTLAMREKEHDVFYQLIDKCIDLDDVLPQPDFGTCLQCAVDYNDIGLIKILFNYFDSYFSIDETSDEDGRSPLAIAASLGNLEMVDLLLSLGANPNAIDMRGDSVLDIAKNELVRELLIACGAKPADPQSKLFCQLCMCLQWRSNPFIDVIWREYLYKNSFSFPIPLDELIYKALDAKSMLIINDLHEAGLIKEKSLSVYDLVEVLRNMKERDIESAIETLDYLYANRLVRCVLDFDAPPPGDYYVASLTASESVSKDRAYALFDALAQFHCGFIEDFHSTMMLAAECANKKLAEYLAEKTGYTIFQLDKERSVLSELFFSHEEIDITDYVRYQDFIDFCRIDINAPLDDDQNTILHQVVKEAFYYEQIIEKVTLLVEYLGADPSIKNKAGELPIDIAMKKKLFLAEMELLLPKDVPHI